MKILLTKKESEDYFFNALCNGLSYMCGYGINMRTSPNEYNAAKARLKEKNFSDGICYEDVLMEILRGGGTLTMEDVEGDGVMTQSITLADVHAKVSKAPAESLMEMANEEDDACTADLILQTVFYNEIIFG